MSDVDFTATNPMRTAAADDPDGLYRAVKSLQAWDDKTLQWSDAILTEWITDSLANPADREGWAELHGLIQRLQSIQALDSQPENTRTAVDSYYFRWNGLADLLAARIHRHDHHSPDEIEGRTHMAELRDLLAGRTELPTKTIQESLQLTASRLSQLLSLAEAAGLIARRKQGRERLVSPAGKWAQAPQESAKTHHGNRGSCFLVFKKAA